MAHIQQSGEALPRQGVQTAHGEHERTEPWQASSNEALVEHILSRYHDRHREQLPELVMLAQRIERVHGSNPHSPAGLSGVLEDLQDELESHMRKEETILFPMIVRGINGMAVRPVETMRREHDDHTAALAEIDRITNGLTLPEGACRSWTALYEGLSELKSDLIDHIELENGVLFERVESSQGEAQHG